MSKILKSVLCLIVSLASYAQCLNQCYVFSLKNGNSKIILAPNHFHAVAKNIESNRQVCQAKYEIFGNYLTIEVNDIFSSETLISVRKGQNILVAVSYSGSQGSISDYSNDIKVTCSK